MKQTFLPWHGMAWPVSIIRAIAHFFYEKGTHCLKKGHNLRYHPQYFVGIYWYILIYIGLFL